MPNAPIKKKATPTPTAQKTKTPVKVKSPASLKVQPAQTVTAKSASAPAPAPKSVKKKEKTEKVKVVRDSFTIPKTEFAQIAAMKTRALTLGLEVKKSELIRAGLLMLAATTDSAFRKAVSNVPTLKTGRPGKS